MPKITPTATENVKDRKIEKPVTTVFHSEKKPTPQAMLNPSRTPVAPPSSGSGQVLREVSFHDSALDELGRMGTADRKRLRAAAPRGSSIPRETAARVKKLLERR